MHTMLPGERTVRNQLENATRRIPAVATHGIPGAAIGGAAVFAIVANHLLTEAWHNLPILISLAGMFGGIALTFAMLYAMITNRLDAEDGPTVLATVTAASIATISTIMFMCIWPWPRSTIPEAPVVIHSQVARCKGVGNHVASSTKDEGPGPEEQIITVVCHDGQIISRSNLDR